MELKTKNLIEDLAIEIKTQFKQPKIKLINSLLIAADVVSRYLDIETAKYSLGRTGLTVLYTLVINGGSMTPTSISKKIFRSKFAVTKILDTLEKLGYVKRGGIGNDRRTREVSITDNGIEVVKSSIIERPDISHKALHRLDKDQLRMLDNLLGIIRKDISSLISEKDGLKKTPV
jgi:DNA-binding MarR family transcriptional regulator